jgi:hypothetical protein
LVRRLRPLKKRRLTSKDALEQGRRRPSEGFFFVSYLLDEWQTMKRQQLKAPQIATFDWDRDCTEKPKTSTRPIRNSKGLVRGKKIERDGDGDREVLLRSLRELVVALSIDRETHLPLGSLSKPFEQWGDGPEVYFAAVLPSLFDVSLDLCISDGHVFVRIER